EIEARFVKLEQSDKENDLRAEIAKLRYDIEEIKLQTRVNTNEWDMPSFAEQSHLRGTEDISHSSTSSPLPVTSPSPIQNSSKLIANTTAVISKIEPISLEDKVINEFLDEVHKEKVSNEIRERNREKK